MFCEENSYLTRHDTQASNECKVEMNISFLKEMNYHAATFIKRKDDMIMLCTTGPEFDSFFIYI